MKKKRPKKKADPRRSWGAFAFGALLILGFALRVWGLAFGLPDTVHADEPIVVNHALAYGSGDLNPHFFKIPPLVSYLLFGVYGLYFCAGWLGGWVQDLAGFQNLFLADPTSFYLIGRVLFGAVAGTLTIGVFGCLIRRSFSQRHALAAAFFLAVNFLHVRDSHFLYADIPLLLVLVASLFPIFRILEQGELAGYLWGGFWVGVAVATKYNGVFIVVPLLAAHFLGRGWKVKSLFSSHLVLAGLVSLAAYSILNPFTWIDFTFFMRELFKQSQSEGFAGFAHHFSYSLAGGLGIPILACAVAGMLAFLLPGEKTPMLERKKRWVLLSFPVAYYFVLAFVSQPYERYVLPVIPFILFFAADFLIGVAGWWKMPQRWVWIFALIAAAPSLAKDLRLDQILSEEDIRAVARGRIESFIPSGAKVALDIPQFMPRLKPVLAQLEEKKRELIRQGTRHAGQFKRIEYLLEDARTRPRPRYELYFMSDPPDAEAFLFAKPQVPYDLAYLKLLGIQYVFFAKISPAHQTDFYKALRSQALYLGSLSPYKNPSREWAIDSMPLTGAPFAWRELVERQRNGHIIEMYRLR